MRQIRLNPATDSEKTIREYSGNPRQLAHELKDEEILVVHDAPVTDEVMDASPNLKLIGCARGGPVNVDVKAATERKITLVSAPGRNAEAVADYVLGVVIILARNLSLANLFLREERKFDRSSYESFFGHELGGKTLGLIGYGNVGSRVAKRALAFGMSVLVYDPFVPRFQDRRPRSKNHRSRNADQDLGFCVPACPRVSGKRQHVWKGSVWFHEKRCLLHQLCPGKPAR